MHVVGLFLPYDITATKESYWLVVLLICSHPRYTALITTYKQEDLVSVVAIEVLQCVGSSTSTSCRYDTDRVRLWRKESLRMPSWQAPSCTHAHTHTHTKINEVTIHKLEKKRKKIGGEVCNTIDF